MSASIAEKLCREAIRNCEPYVAEVRDDRLQEIYLNANENPYFLPMTIDIPMNRYPESQPLTVVQRYAEYLGVDEDEILVTLGGDSSIELLIKAFCEAKEDKLLYCPPTFGMYQVTCDLLEVETVQVPLLADFALDTDGILQNLDGVKMVFLCSPNNPTGNTIPIKEIERILEATKDRAIVVLDEAYIEFSEIESLAKRVKEFPNLALVRTLSKAFALAGIRLGFTVASKPIIDVLKRVINPYPLAVTTIAAAEIALLPENIAWMQEKRQVILQDRNDLQEALAQFAFITKIYPTESNFLLVECTDATKLYEYLKEHGIFVRAQSSARLQNCLRISVGLPEEHVRLIKALKRFEV